MQMTFAVSTFGRKSEFDSFLCAPIGEEQNGMLLSVLSALARLDVDPWQEAATLTKMPPPDATLRLTSLLSSLPSDAATPLTPSAVVRLISLLPQKPPRDRWPRETSDGATTRYWAIAFYLFTAFVITFAEQYAGGHHAPASKEVASTSQSSQAGPSSKIETNPVEGP
jgi:hypothetical protein